MKYNAFEFVYLIGFVAASVIRKVYNIRSRHNRTKKSYQGILDTSLLAVASLGFLLPFLYLFTDVLSFADYNLPTSLGWAGTLIYSTAVLLLWKSHADLGKNFAPVLRIATEHTLVTTGVYKYLRHPMYSAHILWAIAQTMLLANWLAGPAFLLTSWPLYLLRMRTEEKMMLDEYGEKYAQYQKQTGKLIPKLTTDDK